MAEAIVIYIIGSLAVALVMVVILVYLRAAGSRTTYKCPQCGEVFRVELMKASHCNHCGAPLRNGKGNHAQS